MNKVILQGRLTADPDNRTGANDTVICRFTVAVDHYNAREGEKSAIFVPCIMFGQRADVFGHYTHKGDRVLIEGRIDVSNYEDEMGTEGHSQTLLRSNLTSFITRKFHLQKKRKRSQRKNIIKGIDIYHKSCYNIVAL